MSAPRPKPMPVVAVEQPRGQQPVAIPIGRLTKKIQCQLIAW